MSNEYEYVEFIPLTEEEILKRVTQEEIAEMILGYQPILYQAIKSPIKLRKGGDKNPGARFEKWNGKLFFIDFGDSPTHRVILKFVADYYNVKFFEALQIVNDYFQLGLGDQQGKLIIPKPVLQLSKQLLPQDKKKTDIIYKPRPFSYQDKAIWQPYGIRKEELIEDEVTAIVWYKFYSERKKQWVVFRPNFPIYAFTGFQERVKIYRPNQHLKFITNCSENDVGNINNLPVSGKNLIIKKSYKDHRIIRNLNLPDTSVIWFQNEGCVPKQEILLDLCERFDHIYIFFDNDKTGIEASHKLCSIFNSLYPNKAIPLWLPEEFSGKNIKDPGNAMEKGCKKQLTEFLINRLQYEYTHNHTSIMDTPSDSPF